MIRSLIREHLRSFTPYQSARSEIRDASIFLDANELSFGSPVDIEGLPLHRYPDPSQLLLRRRLAEIAGTVPERVFAGAGSDEIIDLLIRLFCEPGRESILVAEPTYGVYRVAANIQNVGVRSRELDEAFQLDGRLFPVEDPAIKLTFLCSPNNPTGNLLRRSDILDLCDRAAGIVVVDEAYVDFAREGASLLSETAGRENLIVLRTLSKSFGLAGIRLGFCVAAPEIVSSLLGIKAPYNINALTAHAAMKALTAGDVLPRNVRRVLDARDWLAAELRRLPDVKAVHPSDANFLLVRFRDAAEVYDALLRRGIVVRRRSEERLRDCLRITVGCPRENERLIGALREGR